MKLSKSQWTSNQLEQFEKADDKYISPFYNDGKTLGTLTWILVSCNKW